MYAVCGSFLSRFVSRVLSRDICLSRVASRNSRVRLAHYANLAVARIVARGWLSWLARCATRNRLLARFDSQLPVAFSVSAELRVARNRCEVTRHGEPAEANPARVQARVAIVGVANVSGCLSQ